MKLNWGHKIAAFYTLFVLFIGVMVYLSFNQKYDLVTENYYEQELKYQNTIDKKERVKALDENLLASIQGADLKIIYPHEDGEIKGRINCFRPSDEEKDFSEEMVTNNGEYNIALDKFSKGKYLLKVEWEFENEEYYKELTVIIP